MFTCLPASQDQYLWPKVIRITRPHSDIETEMVKRGILGWVWLVQVCLYKLTNFRKHQNSVCQTEDSLVMPHGLTVYIYIYYSTYICTKLGQNLE